MPGTLRYQWEPQVARLRRLTAGEEPEHPAEIVVLHTTPEGSRAALKKAAEMAKEVRARVRLVAPQVVPYPLPMVKGSNETDFTRRQCAALAAEIGVEVHVDILLCRDREETAAAVVAPEALVLVGGQRHWWPTQEKKLVKGLRRQGRQVLFTECE